MLSFGAYGDQLVGRYSFNDEKSTIPVTGDALFSSLRPKVHTHNLAFFLDRHLSSRISDSIRVSYGRTKLSFGEVRDPFLLPSSSLPDIPFLLNAPLLLNVTLPNPGLPPPAYISAASLAGQSMLNSLGYSSITQSEQITGPLGQIIIPGFSPLGVDVYNFPQSRHNNFFQLADTITDVRGDHILTYGFDMRKVHINSILDRDFRPLAVFNGLEGLSGSTLAAAGVPTGLFQTLAVKPDSSIGIHFTATNFFFQDSWRFRPNLYFIYGLRYELNSVPKTVGRRVEHAFDPAVLRMQAQQVADACEANEHNGRCADLVGALTSAFPADFEVSFGADRNDIDPRIGFAWNVNGDAKTVVRGGAGLYDGQFQGIVLSQSRNTFPSYLPLNYANFSPRSGNQTYLFNLANPNVRQLDPSLNIIAPGTLNAFPSISPINLLVSELFNLPASLSLSPTAVGLDLVLPQKRLKTPYSLQYGVTLERQVSNDWLFAVSYIGTRGVKLLRLDTPDLGLNRNRVTITNIAPLTAPAPFPFFRGSEASPQTLISKSFSIARTFFESSASSRYNSLQAEVRKRYANRFSFGTALTYSHATDDASDFFDLAGAFSLPQDSLHRSETASSNFDVRFRSVSHFVWDIPAHGKIFEGWQLAGIITAQTGQPYTVNSAFDVNRDGNLTDRLNSTIGLIQNPGDGRVQLSLAPGMLPRSLLAPDGIDGVVGRNTFRAPGVLTVDLAFTKTFSFSVHDRFQLRAEVFNLFNRANYGIPGRILESPSFGISTNTVVPARVIQFSARFRY